MALPTGGGLPDPATMAAYQKSLEAVLSKEIPKAVPSLKQLGGRLGRYNAMLREQMEEVIKLNELMGRTRIADQMTGIMEETMSYLDRDAFRVRKAIARVMNEQTVYSKTLEDHEKVVSTLTQEMEKASDAAEKEVKRLAIAEAERQLKANLERLGMDAEMYEKAKLIVKDFEKARTDTQRDMEVERLNGFLRGQRLLLKHAVETERDLQRLRIKAQEEGNTELLKKVEENLRKVAEKSTQLTRGIEKTTELQARTLDGYKKGLTGTLKEGVSKAFSGGFFGAIFKGQGFAELPGILGKALFDKYAIGSLPEGMRGGVTSFLYGAESEDAFKASAGGLETQKVIAEGSQSMIDLSAEALQPGSIYTHDIHAEKILMDIFDVLSGRQPEKAGKGIADKSKGAPAVKGGKLTGIGRFLQSIAEGVKSFGDRRVFRGAGGMAVVGTSLLPLVGSLALLSQLPVGNLLASTAAIVAIGGAAVFFGKFAKDITAGAFAIGALGIALLPMGLAFNMMGSIDVGNIFSAIGAIAAFAGLVGVLGLLVTGPQAALFIGGVAALALLGVALLPVAGSLMLLSMVDGKALTELGAGLMSLVLPLGLIALMAPLLPLAGYGIGVIGLSLLPMAIALNFMSLEALQVLGTTLTALAENAGGIFLAGGAVLFLSGSLVAFGIAAAAATVALGAAKISSGLMSFLGFGETNILDQIFLLAEKAVPLMVVADSLERIAQSMSSLAGAFSQFGDAEAGLETLDRIANLDATQMQNLRDVSMAIDSVLRANRELTVQNEAALVGQAAGGAAGSGVGSVGVNTVTNFGGSNIFVAGASSRNNDPSIMFSGERYYSMAYR